MKIESAGAGFGRLTDSGWAGFGTEIDCDPGTQKPPRLRTILEKYPNLYNPISNLVEMKTFC